MPIVLADLIKMMCHLVGFDLRIHYERFTDDDGESNPRTLPTASIVRLGIDSRDPREREDRTIMSITATDDETAARLLHNMVRRFCVERGVSESMLPNEVEKR